MLFPLGSLGSLSPASTPLDSLGESSVSIKANLGFPTEDPTSNMVSSRIVMVDCIVVRDVGSVEMLLL